jgi:hypothetical protein
LGELYVDTSQREKGLENLKKAEVMFKEMGMNASWTRWSDLEGQVGMTLASEMKCAS